MKKKLKTMLDLLEEREESQAREYSRMFVAGEITYRQERKLSKENEEGFRYLRAELGHLFKEEQ